MRDHAIFIQGSLAAAMAAQDAVTPALGRLQNLFTGMLGDYTSLAAEVQQASDDQFCIYLQESDFGTILRRLSRIILHRDVSQPMGSDGLDQGLSMLFQVLKCAGHHDLGNEARCLRGICGHIVVEEAGSPPRRERDPRDQMLCAANEFR